MDMGLGAMCKVLVPDEVTNTHKRLHARTDARTHACVCAYAPFPPHVHAHTHTHTTSSSASFKQCLPSCGNVVCFVHLDLYLDMHLCFLSFMNSRVSVVQSMTCPGIL